jgi:hypothetical protein
MNATHPIRWDATHGRTSMFERDVDRLPDSTHLQSMPSLWPSVEPQPDLQHAGHLHQRPPDSHHRDATTEQAGCCAPIHGLSAVRRGGGAESQRVTAGPRLLGAPLVAGTRRRQPRPGHSRPGRLGLLGGRALAQRELPPSRRCDAPEELPELMLSRNAERVIFALGIGARYAVQRGRPDMELISGGDDRPEGVQDTLPGF